MRLKGTAQGDKAWTLLTTMTVLKDFEEKKGEWEVVVERDGKETVLRPRQPVLALGVSGYANVPKIPGADTFLGDQHHSGTLKRMRYARTLAISSFPSGQRGQHKEFP